MERLHAKRAAIIFNPFAGRIARAERLLQRTIKILQHKGIEATLMPTLGPGQAAAQTRREIEAGCDLIVAAGGDGTINEIVNGMVGTNIPLAILPGGTANVLAHELRLPRSLERAAGMIPDLTPCRISAGVLGNGSSHRRYFLLMAGAGLDAQIVYHLNLDLKAIAGKLAYYLCGFSQIFRPLAEFEVTVDGKGYRAGFALITRVRNYGGDLEISRGASLLRDDFEVLLFRGKKSVEYLRYLAGVLTGRVAGMSGCTVLAARSVICHPPEKQAAYVQVDGELVGKLPMFAEIRPDALTILVPSAYWQREQGFLQSHAVAV